MSKVAIIGNAAGAGVFTIASPNSNENRTLTLPDQSGTIAFNPPAFRAYLDTDQSITSDVATKVQINAKTGDNFFDTHGWFDTTNNRYVPQIPGYYSFNGILRLAGVSQTVQAIFLHKNGTTYSVGTINRVSTSSSIHTAHSDIIYLNGTTDYVELYGLVTATSGAMFDFASTTATCFFSGFLVRAS